MQNRANTKSAKSAKLLPSRLATPDEQNRVIRGVVAAMFVSLPVWLTVGSLTLIILR